MRAHRAFPWVPTVMVALALPILVGLGLWQISRMHWKDQLIAEMHAAAISPRLIIDGAIPATAAFREVKLTLDCPTQKPNYEAARNKRGESGWSTILICAGPEREGVELLLGWSARPDGWDRMGANRPAAGPREVNGTILRGHKVQWRLYAEDEPPPLQPIQPPAPQDLPNNHLSYAIQWFSFAAILAVIYGLWLRRWLAQRGGQA
jgi:cytochrome oxidase assembly protein ShyY1